MDNLLPIILIVLVLALGAGAIFIIIRRRRAAMDDVPLPDIGDPVDYTSMPEEEEAPGLRERFDNLPLPAKIAILASPLVIIGLIVIIFVFSAFMGGESPSPADQPPTSQEGEGTPAEPTPPPPVIEIETADLVNADSIRLNATTTNLAAGTEVFISLQENGKPFSWLADESTTASVENDEIDARLSKKPDAPKAQEGLNYSLVITATSESGQVAEGQKELGIPDNLKNAFFQPPPPPTPSEPEEATEQPAEEPVDETAEEPVDETAEEPVDETAEQTQETSDLLASVGFGGNIRGTPAGEPILGQVAPLETVELMEKTTDQDGDTWYYLQVQGDPEREGWVHDSLLDVPADVAAQVPAAEGTADADMADQQPEQTDGAEDSAEQPTDALVGTVAYGGNVRATPGGTPIRGQVAPQQTVELMEKTVDQAGDTWYHLQVQGDTDLEGWVHYTLLSVPADVASQVPMVEEPAAEEEPAEEEPAEEEPVEEEPVEEEPAEDTADMSDPTVSVFNGGNVRPTPGGDPPSAQIHANEQVELLKKTADGTWFFMRVEDREGWVHRTLLEPEELAAVEAEVPVAE